MNDTATDLYRISVKRRWGERLEEVPYLSFPSDWLVRVSPPFGSVDARFQVMKGAAKVSVYLDMYSSSGYYGPLDSLEPYWEVYPHDGDIFRCAMSDASGLIQAIQESITEQNQ